MATKFEIKLEKKRKEGNRKMWEIAEKLGTGIQYRNFGYWQSQPYIHVNGVDVFLIANLFGKNINGIEPFWALPKTWQTVEHVLECAEDAKNAHEEYSTLGYCQQDDNGKRHFHYMPYDEPED